GVCTSTSSCWKNTRWAGCGSRARRPASSTDVQSAALAWTTKLRVNRPPVAGCAPCLLFGSVATGERTPGLRRRRGSTAEAGTDGLASFACRRRVLHIGHSIREAPPQQGERRGGLARGSAVHRRQHGDLGARPVVGARAGMQL